MKINGKNFGFLLAGLMLLPGCMHVPVYHQKPLKSVDLGFTSRDVEKNIIVQVKRLTRGDCYEFFGAKGQHISDSFDVIYLSVHNLSNVAYLLLPADVDCAMLSPQEVAKGMKTNSVTKLAGGVVSIGTTFAPIFLTMGFLGGPAIPLGIGISLATISAGLGLTAFGMGIKSIIMNHRIKRDLKEKMLHKKVVIKSGDHYEGLIFVKSSDYKPQFSVTVHEQNDRNNKIIFDVELR